MIMRVQLPQVILILTGLSVANFIFLHFNEDKRIMNDYEVILANERRPFPMPIHGKNYEIFQPLYDMEASKKNPQLFLPPMEFVNTFEERISWAKSMVVIDVDLKVLTSKEHAVLMYIDMIKTFVSGSAFRHADLSIKPPLRKGHKILRALPFDESLRDGGRDWTFAGDTMTGRKRLDNVHALLKDVIENKVAGDYIETGVWRGGSSVLAKAVLETLDPNSNRISYVCDSFSGLPPGEKKLAKGDVGWDNIPYLEVPSDVVANNFIKYGLLDSNVIFAKGFFNDTMPLLAEKITSLSIMRLDGDMYESTVDVLYHLYNKLSIGGYVIMDDWFRFPSKIACEDFFAAHGIKPEIIPIDDLSAYWKKTEHVQVQYWRYEQSTFKL
jgi:O-methyltransferase